MAQDNIRPKWKTNRIDRKGKIHVKTVSSHSLMHVSRITTSIIAGGGMLLTNWLIKLRTEWDNRQRVEHSAVSDDKVSHADSLMLVLADTSCLQGQCE
jgi:hypothetical protein